MNDLFELINDIESRIEIATAFFEGLQISRSAEEKLKAHVELSVVLGLLKTLRSNLNKEIVKQKRGENGS